MCTFLKDLLTQYLPHTLKTASISACKVSKGSLDWVEKVPTYLEFI